VYSYKLKIDTYIRNKCFIIIIMDTFESAFAEIIEKKTKELTDKINEREKVKKEIREAAVADSTHGDK